MKPEKLSILNLFQLDRRYVVPLFQRPYVWNRDDHWEPLWEDLLLKCREAATIQEMPDNERPNARPHFLGAIVLEQIRTSTSAIETRRIIDGQQRMTTIQLFLKALRDLVEVLIPIPDGGYPPADISQLRRITEHQVGNIKRDEKFKVWPSKADRAAFESVMQLGSRYNVEADFPKGANGERNRIADAYCYFSKQVEEYLKESNGGAEQVTPELIEERFSVLMIVLREYMRFIVIDLEDEDDPQVIFETLNARGEPLLVSDLVRNFVFLKAKDQSSDIDTLYENYWEHYDNELVSDEVGARDDERFWQKQEQIGRERRARLDFFLATYLRYKSTKAEINLGHLYREFQDWWNADADEELNLLEGIPTAPTDGADGNQVRITERSCESELASLKQHSEIFRSIVVPDRSDRVGVFAERLKIFDTTTLYPVLMLLIARRGREVPTAELEGIITDLESFIVRRSVCGLTTKNYNNFFHRLLRGMRRSSSVDRKFVRRLLLETKIERDRRGDSTRWPNDEEFEKAWLNLPSYAKLKSGKTRGILEALEDKLRLNGQAMGLQERVLLPKDLTVEHVMPQKWQQNWTIIPDSIEAPLNADETPEARRFRLLHSFGNLTLLTQPLNSKDSNSSFSEKRTHIRNNSVLNLNKYFSDQEHWDEDTIRTRGKLLTQLAVSIWPHPGDQLSF